MHPMDVSENYPSSGMLTILLTAQSNILLANPHILYLKGPNDVFSEIDYTSIQSVLLWHISTRLTRKEKQVL